MDIKTQLAQNFIWISIIAGLVLCFTGYRIFRFILILFGFITVALFTGDIVFEYSGGNEIAAILAGTIGGLIGAGVMIYLLVIGVFLIGATVGIGIVLFCLKLLMSEHNLLILIIAAISGGLLAVLFRKFIIILATSFEGAWGVVTGVAFIFAPNFDPLHPNTVFALEETQVYRIVVSFLALGMAGFIFQYTYTPVRSGGNDDEDDNSTRINNDIDERLISKDQDNRDSSTLRQPGDKPATKTL